MRSLNCVATFPAHAATRRDLSGVARITRLQAQPQPHPAFACRDLDAPAHVAPRPPAPRRAPAHAAALGGCRGMGAHARRGGASSAATAPRPALCTTSSSTLTRKPGLEGARGRRGRVGGPRVALTPAGAAWCSLQREVAATSTPLRAGRGTGRRRGRTPAPIHTYTPRSPARSGTPRAFARARGMRRRARGPRRRGSTPRYARTAMTPATSSARTSTRASASTNSAPSHASPSSATSPVADEGEGASRRRASSSAGRRWRDCRVPAGLFVVLAQRGSASCSCTRDAVSWKPRARGAPRWRQDRPQVGRLLIGG